MLTVNGGRIVVGKSMQHNETTGMSLNLSRGFSWQPRIVHTVLPSIFLIIIITMMK